MLVCLGSIWPISASSWVPPRWYFKTFVWVESCSRWSLQDDSHTRCRHGCDKHHASWWAHYFNNQCIGFEFGAWKGRFILKAEWHHMCWMVVSARKSWPVWFLPCFLVLKGRAKSTFFFSPNNSTLAQNRFGRQEWSQCKLQSPFLISQTPWKMVGAVGKEWSRVSLLWVQGLFSSLGTLEYRSPLIYRVLLRGSVVAALTFWEKHWLPRHIYLTNPFEIHF